LSGSSAVSPVETTTYTLVASNEEDKTVEREVRVEVVDVHPLATPAQAPSHALKPWAEADAIITSRDGIMTRVRAETLSYVISVVHSFDLSSGQTVDFEKMRSFEILTADPEESSNSKATVLITLLDGRTITDKINSGYGYDIFGYNDLGRFSIKLQNLKRVEFLQAFDVFLRSFH
jgi:hypothetical protein